LKQYGMILADNGSSWFITGTQDSRIDDNEMHQLTQLVGADFEAVDESSLMVSQNSAQAAVQASANPGSASGSVPTGWVNLVSKNSNKCLGVNSAAPYAAILQATCVGGTNQQFQLVPVSGGYKITVRSSGLQFHVKGGAAAVANGVVIDQYPYQGTTNQIFRATRATDGSYELIAVNSGKAVTVANASKADSAGVQQWSLTGAANQKWSLVPAS